MGYEAMRVIIGLRVEVVKGYEPEKRKRCIEPRYILFDDGKTFMVLEDQDYRSYHDCSSEAKKISIRQDARMWGIIRKNEEGVYPNVRD